jgi:hypothetical protein
MAERDAILFFIFIFVGRAKRGSFSAALLTTGTAILLTKKEIACQM